MKDAAFAKKDRSHSDIRFCRSQAISATGTVRSALSCKTPEKDLTTFP